MFSGQRRGEYSWVAVNVPGRTAYSQVALTTVNVIPELFVLQNKKATVHNEDELLHQDELDMDHYYEQSQNTRGNG